MPAIRRSGRQRQSTSKYGTTILDKETLRQLRASSESSNSSSPESSVPEEATSDRDFDETRLEDEGEEEEVSDYDSLLSDAGAGRDEYITDDGSEIPSPNSDEEEEFSDLASLGSGELELGNPSSAAKLAKRRKAQAPCEQDEHSRGGLYPNKGAARVFHWIAMGGPEEDDLVSLIVARDRWAGKRDATFPSRISLAKVAEEGVYGDTVRFAVGKEELIGEYTEGWEWYDEDIGQKFRRRQVMKELRGQESDQYVSHTNGSRLKVVLGPTDEQQQYEISTGTALEFGKAFERKSKGQKDGVESSSVSRYREGWLLNLGARIRCLAWAPNRQYENVQYLAVSKACSKKQRQVCAESQYPDKAQAFYPSPNYPSAIEIWEFESRKGGDGLQRLNMEVEPKLIRVFCTDWGEIKHLEWCPVLREGLRDKDHSMTSLGLLGILFSDGHIRVLGLEVPTPSDEEIPNSIHHHVKHAAFDATPSSSIYTCFSWASATDLLCGTAQGTVELFNILPASEGQPKPSFTFQQSLSYLLTICSTQPSPFPHLLASLSMSAIPILTDLRSPETDRVSGKSVRVGNKCMAYSAHLRTVLTAGPEGDDLLAFPVRRFFMTTRLGRIGGQGSITALATSRWHPCALFGTSGGAVCASNVLRGLIPTLKKVGGKGQDCMVQKLCEYQWIPSCKTAATSVRDGEDRARQEEVEDRPAESSSSSSDAYHIPDARPGTSRFYESFKPERQNFSYNPPASRRASTKPSKGPFTGASQHYGAATVYPEEQAVTALEWNPNIACAGWIAVGWGSGLLRVEDVAHDQT